jgi:hypothetical protein
MARRAVAEALHALLICAGGDIPAADGPTEALTEIADLNAALAAPLNRLAPSLERLAALTESGASVQVDAVEIRERLHVAEAVVRYVRRAVQRVMALDTPCPASS